MILEILIFILTSVLVYYLYCYRWVHGYFEKRDVKYVPGVPIFGNIFKSTFLKTHYFDDLDVVYKAYPDEKYVGFIEFTKPVLIIRDPELIKNITVKDFDHFVDHKEFFSNDMDPLFGSSLFSMKGEKWHNMRTSLSPAFTSSKMKYLMPFMQDNANNIVEYIKEHISEDTDALDLVRRYTNDVIASAVFGLEVNSLKDRDNEFYMIGSNLLNFTFTQRINLILNTMLPGFSKISRWRLFPDNVYNFFTNIVASTLEYRKKEQIKRPDMIQLLMETSKEWTMNDLIAQAFIFFAAGFDTSASALAMAIHEIALNPKIQEKLYQEVRKHKEENVFRFESLSELKYLECVISETLRKWSPAIFMDRACVKQYELPPPREGGRPYSIKPGDIVFNMVNCLHMDPKYFPEPEIFDPDRFSEENKCNIEPYTFQPFGVGPRICIGMRFAYMEIKVLLYQLVLNFKMCKCPKTTDPIRLQPDIINLKSLGGSWIKFEPRN